jgi:hypothetical protein
MIITAMMISFSRFILLQRVPSPWMAKAKRYTFLKNIGKRTSPKIAECRISEDASEAGWRNSSIDPAVRIPQVEQGRGGCD